VLPGNDLRQRVDIAVLSGDANIEGRGRASSRPVNEFGEVVEVRCLNVALGGFERLSDRPLAQEGGKQKEPRQQQRAAPRGDMPTALRLSPVIS